MLQTAGETLEHQTKMSSDKKDIIPAEKREPSFVKRPLYGMS